MGYYAICYIISDFHPHSASNPFGDLVQPKHENPIKPWLSENGKVRPENNVTPRKKPCHKNKINHMQYHACQIWKGKYTRISILARNPVVVSWSYLSLLFSFFPLAFFAFLEPKHNHRKILSQDLTLTKSLPTDPQKPCYQWGLYFLHFPLSSFIFILTCNLWPFTFLFS